jgi:transcriptional regulator with XRE-family HTH domain
MNLTDWMKREGVSSDKLAEKVGVSGPFIRRIRSGERQPSLHVAQRLIEITGLPIETFLKDEAA